MLFAKENKIDQIQLKKIFVQCHLTLNMVISFSYFLVSSDDFYFHDTATVKETNKTTI